MCRKRFVMFTENLNIQRLQHQIRRCPEVYICTCLILLVRFMWYKNVTIAQLYPDSYSYMNYGWAIPSNGRTPVYPYIINFCRMMCGESTYLVLVVLVQISASLLSLVALYRILVMTTKNHRLALLVTTGYGCSPTIMSWDTMIVTESLAISGCVLFLYLILCYLEAPSVKDGILAILLMLLLTMLKPSFLIGNYVLFGFLLLRLFDRMERRILKKLIPVSGIVLLSIFAYSAVVNQIYGTFSITTLLPRHILAMCLRSEVYLYYPDQALVDSIQKIYLSTNQSIAYDTTTPVMELFGSNAADVNRAVSAFCRECISRAPIQYLVSLCNTMFNCIQTSFCTTYATKVIEHPVFSTILSFQTVLFSFLKIGHLYLVCVLETARTLLKWICKRQLDWIHLGLMTFLILFTATTFFGTYAEFARSSIHALPLMVLSITLLLNDVISWLSKADKAQTSVE